MAGAAETRGRGDDVSEGAPASRVLILDADQRSALAATRSLGKRGVVVIAGDERMRTLAGASRDTVATRWCIRRCTQTAVPSSSKH